MENQNLIDEAIKGAYGEDYEYIPGGLDNMKTHVIIKTERGDFHSDSVQFLHRGSNEQSK